MERVRHALELDEDIALVKKAWVMHIVAWLIFYDIGTAWQISKRTHEKNEGE